MVTIKESKDGQYEYVVIDDFKNEKFKKKFRDWLVDGGHTLPLVEEEGDNATNCAFVEDYYRFIRENPMYSVQVDENE